MDSTFKQQLPRSLYLDHYALSAINPSYTPEEWRRYLKENERFIMQEVSAITEAHARKAISLLATGDPSSATISAIKELLSKSEQINKQTRDVRTFVTMNLTTQPDPDPVLLAKEFAFRFYNIEHDEFDTHLYNFLEKYPNISPNADGTFHMVDLTRATERDLAYLRVANPTNEQTTQMPEPEGTDIQ